MHTLQPEVLIIYFLPYASHNKSVRPCLRGKHRMVSLIKGQFSEDSPSYVLVFALSRTTQTRNYQHQPNCFGHPFIFSICFLSRPSDDTLYD